MATSLEKDPIPYRRIRRHSLALLALAMPLSEAALVAQAPPAESAASESACKGELATVTKVVDGGTLEIELAGTGRTVLLACVATPQLANANRLVEYLGVEAAALTRAFTEGKEVCLLADEALANPDSSGRLLRYVYLPDGSDLNGTLLASGFGMFYPGHPCARQEEYRQLERDARKRSVGLWDPQRRITYENQVHGVAVVATFGAPSSEMERIAAPSQMGRSGPYLLWSPVTFSYGGAYGASSTARIRSYYRGDGVYARTYWSSTRIP